MLKLLPTCKTELQELSEKSPDGFPWDRIGQGGGVWLLGKNETMDCGETAETLSEVCFLLAKEILAEATRYMLEVRKEGHPLLQQVRKKRYAAADVPDLITLASKITRYGKLLKKKGY